MLVVYIGIAALVGGIVNGLLGWLNTTDPFVLRKFLSSVIASVLGAAIIAISFDLSGTSNLVASLFVAFLSGAGVSAGTSRVAGAIHNR